MDPRLQAYSGFFAARAMSGDPYAAIGLAIIDYVAVDEKSEKDIGHLMGYQPGLLSSSFKPIPIEALTKYLTTILYLRDLTTFCSNASNFRNPFLTKITFLKQYQQTLQQVLDELKQRAMEIKKPDELCTAIEALRTVLSKEITPLISSHFKHLQARREAQAARRQWLFNFKNPESLAYQQMNKGVEVIAEGLSKRSDTTTEHALTQFLDQLKTIIDKIKSKKRITYTDIHQLKGQHLRLKKFVLSIPETKEIKRFHWFINTLCNLLNKLIQVFESNSSRAIKTKFGQWERLVAFAEDNLTEYDSKLEKMKSEAIKLSS